MDASKYILLLIFGRNIGREAVIVIALTMIVLIIIGPVTKEIVGRDLGQYYVTIPLS